MKLSQYTIAEQTLIQRARAKCIEWHAGQVRKYTGEPYHVHPCAVAKKLMSIGAAAEVVAAGYLHDVIEECGKTAEQIETLFGPRVRQLVVMVTDISKLEDGNRKIRKKIDEAHLAKADEDGQTIKAADLIDNSPTIILHGKGFTPIYMGEKRDLLKVITLAHPVLLAEANKIVEDYWASQATEEEEIDLAFG